MTKRKYIRANEACRRINEDWGEKYVVNIFGDKYVKLSFTLDDLQFSLTKNVDEATVFDSEEDAETKMEFLSNMFDKMALVMEKPEN